MTNEELVELIRKGIDRKDNLEKLYAANRGLIFTIAQSYGRDDIEDLAQEAFIGLVKAVEHFDESQGVQFATYAPFWIRSAMQNYIEGGGESVRLPRHARTRISKYKRAVARFRVAFGRDPLPCELVDALGVKEIDLEQIRSDALKLEAKSLYEPLADDLTIADTLQADFSGYDEIEQQIYNAELAAVLWPLVDSLEAIERDVIKQKYLYNATYEQIGRTMGKTQGAARAKVETALRHLKLISRPLESFRDKDRYSLGLRRASFYRTHTSSTERAALLMLEVLK